MSRSFRHSSRWRGAKLTRQLESKAERRRRHAEVRSAERVPAHSEEALEVLADMYEERGCLERAEVLRRGDELVP